MGGSIVGIILILIGISALTGISIGGFIVTVILIAIGIRILARHSGNGVRYSTDWHHKTTSDERSIDEVAIFSPLNKSVTTEHFTGGRIVMVFSGGEIDLTQAKADGTDVHLEVSSVFSGIEITVPKEWNVKSTANVFLGNVDTHSAQGDDGPVTLVIHGDAVFGEIEVRK
jgi:predicted membrane protein